MSAPGGALAQQLAQLGDVPGVYRFYDSAGALLYVGKAKSLRKRVRTYFGAAAAKAPRLRIMVPAIDRVEVTQTPTEDDALILEHEQITALRPRYNVMFRDDKSYPYLRLSTHRFPRLSTHRGVPGEGCHGPYPSVWSVTESIRVLQRAFRLRTCTDSEFAKRTRPCLLHGIGKCSAPCVGEIGEDDYAAAADTARRFIGGADESVGAELAADMEAAAERRDYEEAARCRDSIKALADIRHLSAVAGGAPDADYLGLHMGDDGVAVRLVAVRGGRCTGELDFFPVNAEGGEPAEIVGAFVAQHYSRHRLPARVVMRCQVPPGLLERLAGGKSTFVTVPRDTERERVDMAAANAAAALRRRNARDGAAKSALGRLGDVLSLPPPGLIDCFDVSHISGEEAVASCVVCADGQMSPDRYRRYRLRSTPKADDYAGMREVLSRRYRKAAAGGARPPDLVVVDGGAGQVSAAVGQLAEMGLGDTPVLGIAKGEGRRPGRETLVTGDGELLDVKPTDPAFLLLQRMRDEAHRFALAGHRKRREKKRGSTLEDIEGVGPARRRSLINEFGGLQGLKRASVRDLSRIRGVGPELARRIYRALHA